VIAVSDASPLILFARASRLALLRWVFESLVIPPRVAGESFRDVPSRPGAAALTALLGGWLREAIPVDRSAVETLQRQVDPGEAEAIVLSMGWGPVAEVFQDGKGEPMLAAILYLLAAVAEVPLPCWAGRHGSRSCSTR
jgi:predicted nucleic acid-binding protein